MKKKLEKHLQKIDRPWKWFWKEKIIGLCTYAYFMEMMAGNVPIRDDVKKAITDYLGEK